MTRRLPYRPGLRPARSPPSSWAVCRWPPPPTPSRPARADDVQDVVLLADGRPVFLRLHIEIDGQPFRAAHAEALRSLPRRAIHTARLRRRRRAERGGSQADAVAVQAARDGRRLAVHVAFNYRVVDADGDGKISREEMAEYHREFSGGAAQVQPAARTVIPPRWTRRCSTCWTRTRTANSPRRSWPPRRTCCPGWTRTATSCLSPQEIAPAVYATGDAGPGMDRSRRSRACDGPPRRRTPRCSSSRPTRTGPPWRRPW